VSPVLVVDAREDAKPEVARRIEHVRRRGRVGAHHGEAGRCDRLHVGAHLRVVRKQRTIGAPGEGSIRDATKRKALLAGLEMLSVDLYVVERLGGKPELRSTAPVVEGVFCCRRVQSQCAGLPPKTRTPTNELASISAVYSAVCWPSRAA